jgi:hypothetical protein
MERMNANPNPGRCSNCGASWARCEMKLRRDQRPCCSACATTVTHDQDRVVETARTQTEEDLLGSALATVNRQIELLDAAARDKASTEARAEFEYRLACELCSMLADYLNGVPIKLSELSVEARRRIIAYQHAAGLGQLGIAGSDEHGPLPSVPHVERARRDVLGKVIDVDPL